MGKEIKPWANITPDSVYSFSYTGGTTGKPKGVVLTHRMISNMVASIENVLNFDFDKFTMRYVSYLPMPHIFERVVFNCAIFTHGHLGVF